MHNVSTRRELQADVRRGEDHLGDFLVYRWLRAMHAVPEGLMTLVEDKRPEANQHIELGHYALQRHTHKLYNVDVS